MDPNPAPRRTVRSFLLLCLAVLLAGCGGLGPRDLTAAELDSAAVAAVQRFEGSLVDAMATGSTLRFEQLSHPECDACADTLESLHAVFPGPMRARAQKVEWVEEPVVERVAGADVWLVSTVLELGEIQTVNLLGEIQESVGAPPQRASYAMLREEDGWRVLEYQVGASNDELFSALEAAGRVPGGS